MTKKYFLFIITILFSLQIFSQATNSITDVEKQFKEAKELFIQKQYALSYPLLQQMQQELIDNQKSNHQYYNEDVTYYYIVCELKLQLPIATIDAKNFIAKAVNEPRIELISYYLGKYYFDKQDYENAITNYERASIDNLSNSDIGDAKFEMAYSYFNLKRFDDAKPLFDEIHQLEDSKYYYPANYYYGFICYYNHQYSEALRAFKLVENQDDYKRVVPYYVAEIYYFQKKKDQATKYAEEAIANGNLYYEKELKQLLGQIYFEKKDFAKALPLLEYYVTNSNKVSKEDLYELSFCYLKANNLDKAIDGFKQLSNEQDSLGQNSMYLLGDCYLQTNQKENARTAFQYCAYNSSNKKQQEVSAFNYAKLSYELSYQDIALNELHKFINRYPNSIYNTSAKEILVSLLANTNNFTDALSMYQSFDNPTPTMQKAYPRILYGKAVEYINDQQIIKADELLNKILQLSANNYTAYANFWKGEIAFRLNKYDEAIRYLSSFLQSNVSTQGEANSTTAKYTIGYSFFKKENYKQALSYFEQITKTVSITSSTVDQDAFVRSADCYYMVKDFTKANSMYALIVNNALPQSDYALYQQSMIAGIKNPSEKIKILNNLLRLYPQSSLANNANLNIATTYMTDEKFKDAIPFLNNLLTTPTAQGMKPKIYLNLGLCYYNIDNNDEALNNYQQLIDTYPSSPEADEAMDNIKNIYVEEGKPNEYVKLMRKNGKNISISEADSLTYNSAQLKYAANDCAAAIAGFTNYLSQFPTGAYSIDANYSLGDCYSKNKDWINATLAYNAVTARGLNKYFEKSALASAKINYFELKDYSAAKKNFELLHTNATNPDNHLEASRGLVRCYYQLKDYVQANEIAKGLLTMKGISTDDKSIAFLVLGKSQQLNNDCTAAISSFKSCTSINKAAWGAEARYEIAHCQFTNNNFGAAEKAAMVVIKETGSYDYWVTKSYILLGDIFMQKKDYFNAKATYLSVATNSTIVELKTEAQQKLDKAINEENNVSKISNTNDR